MLTQRVASGPIPSFKKCITLLTLLERAACQISPMLTVCSREDSARSCRSWSDLERKDHYWLLLKTLLVSTKLPVNNDLCFAAISSKTLMCVGVEPARLAVIPCFQYSCFRWQQPVLCSNVFRNATALFIDLRRVISSRGFCDFAEARSEDIGGLN